MKKTTKSRVTTTSELAAYLSLSRSTVSRVLNGHPGIKPKTVKLVQDALKEVHFVRNPYPTFMLRRQTDTIGVLLSSLERPAIVRKLVALQDKLREHHLRVLIGVTGDDSARAEATVSYLIEMRVDAVAFLGSFKPALAQTLVAPLRAQGIPALATDEVGIPDLERVVLNRGHAMELLTSHLLDLGHRRLGLLGIRPHAPHNDVRLQGIETALRSRGLEPSAHIVRSNIQPVPPPAFVFGEQVAADFMQMTDMPTAFLSLNDEVAIGAMQYFQHQGLRVPDDVSVAGFDNIELGQVMKPALTTVDVCVANHVSTLLDGLLYIRSHRGRLPERSYIEPRVIFRESTGPCLRTARV